MKKKKHNKSQAKEPPPAVLGDKPSGLKRLVKVDLLWTCLACMLSGVQGPSGILLLFVMGWEIGGKGSLF